MSARDRRLREAAAERDRQDSATDESAFDEGLRQAAERQSPSRDIRPGRGTEDRVVEREPSPDRDDDDDDDRARPSPAPSPDRRPDRGAVDQPDRTSRERVEDIEQSLQEASETIRREGQEFFAQDVAVLGGEAFTEQPGAVGAAVRGTGRGLTGLADVPGTALGLAAGAGFAGARLGEVGRGEPDVAFQRTQQAADEAIARGVEAAREQPVETGFALGASLVGSAGVFGAASAAGRGAGTATRFAIQPGEELLGRGGFAATRAVGGERRAQQLFPMQEPLLFSEEAVIRSGRGAAERLRGADVSVRGVGGGVPAFEVRLRGETETEPELGREELETPTLLVESERVRSRLEEEVLTEFEFETETETVQELEFRTELEVPPPLEFQAAAETFIESELLQELELETETELESELTTELLLEQEAEAEQEAVLEGRVETRRVETEPIFGLEEDDEEELFRELDFEGVREVEAVLDPGELDIE